MRVHILAAYSAALYVYVYVWNYLSRSKKNLKKKHSPNDREKRVLYWTRRLNVHFIIIVFSRSLSLSLFVLCDAAATAVPSISMNFSRCTIVRIPARWQCEPKGTVLSFHKQPIRFYRAICKALRQ